MLQTYTVDGSVLDSLDVKVLLVGQGVQVDDEVCEAMRTTCRVPRTVLNRRKWGAMILPDETVVNVADVGQPTPFHLKLGRGGSPCLEMNGRFLTDVAFPPATALFDQTTSTGRPFRDFASMQGRDVLTFAYLWPCAFAKARLACKFCHRGNDTQRRVATGMDEDVRPTAKEVAEVVHYAVNVERCARHVQLTGGSTFDVAEEIDRYAAILRVIDTVAGRASIPGELLVYTTPPMSPQEVDSLFAAGVGRVMCDIEFWNDDCLREMCPGKARWTGRQRPLDTLLHIARTYGRNRACSEFVAGAEDVESFMAGAEYLASHGIVPLPSIWCPHGNPGAGRSIAPGLEYYRRLRRGIAEIYERHRVEPPGDIGFNVCFSRDIWNHREAILRAA